MKKYLPAIVCGFGAGVLNIVPLVKSFSCCMIIPVAAVLCLHLDQKASGNRSFIKPSKAVALGLLTGIFAALFSTVFEVIIVYITKNSDFAAGLPAIQQMMTQLTSSEMATDMMNIMYKMLDDITKYGFSLIYTLSILFSSLIINTVMGIIGGLIGMQVLNSRLKNEE